MNFRNTFLGAKYLMNGIPVSAGYKKTSVIAMITMVVMLAVLMFSAITKMELTLLIYKPVLTVSVLLVAVAALAQVLGVREEFRRGTQP